MIKKSLVFLHRKLNIKNSETFFDVATAVIMLTAQLLDIAVVLLIGIFFGKFYALLFAVLAAMVIRFGRGEHSDEFAECFMNGALIYTMYAVASVKFNNSMIDVGMAIAIAVLFIHWERGTH